MYEQNKGGGCSGRDGEISMKILLLTTHLNTGGIASYCLTQVNVLKGRHKVIVASSGGDTVSRIENEGAAHLYINIRTKSELSPKIFTSVLTLLPVIRKECIDVIHAHTRVTQVLACLLSFITCVSYVPTCLVYFRQRLGRRLFKCWGRKVVAISDAVESHLITDLGVHPDAIRLIYTGIDAKHFKRSYSAKEILEIRTKFSISGGPVIGMVGRLSPVKGQKTLLEAAPSILRDFPDARFLFIGEGPSEHGLKELVDRLGIEESTVFVRTVHDTAQPLAIMDVFAFPSIKEGLGLSLMEALSAGRPCVASDTGGIGSIIDNGRNGLLVPPGDAEGLADAIKRVLKDGDLRAGLAMHAPGSAERFSLGDMSEEMNRFYSDVFSEKRRRILIVNVNWLGDVIFSGPFIRAVRERYPDAFIACMAVPRCKELLELNKRIDEIIEYDDMGRERGLPGKMLFIKKIADMRFDTAIFLHRSFTRALIAALAGIKERVGYFTAKRRFLLTKALVPEMDPYHDTACHRVDYFLGLADAVDARSDVRDYEFFISDDDRAGAAMILRANGVADNDKFIAMNPGGNWDPKRWPVENYAALADWVIDRYGYKVVISGAKKDSGLAETILAKMRGKASIICSKTSIREAAAVFERSALVVSGDSGPMHIAVAMGANVVAIFGPTSPSMTGPVGKGSYKVLHGDSGCTVPCYDEKCDDNRCMKSVTPEMVIDAAREML